ncbi:MAG: DNA-binding protein [Campylobacterota bacterium]|nr:DNA-binding protein [Campylobacterota bacterium]
MKKLVSSSEAAEILGLSLQGVHYRIKKGQLESVKQDGKTFVYVDKTTKINETKKITQSTLINSANEEILNSKEQQILLLKKTIKFMKKQYSGEINRLEENQSKVMSVFQSEVDLLKSAFHEMKTIYQIDNKSKNDIIKDEKADMQFMDIKDFFKFMKQHKKSDSQIKQIILNCVKNGDKRFIYKKENKEVIIYKSDFIDLI